MGSFRNFGPLSFMNRIIYLLGANIIATHPTGLRLPNTLEANE